MQTVYSINALRYVANRPGVCRPSDAEVQALADRQLVKLTDPNAWVFADRFSLTPQGVHVLTRTGRWDS